MTHGWAGWREPGGFESVLPRHTDGHVQNGTPLFALQELGGWSSTEVVRRYAHLAADHLTPYADRLATFRAGTVEVVGTK